MYFSFVGEGNYLIIFSSILITMRKILTTMRKILIVMRTFSHCGENLSFISIDCQRLIDHYVTAY